MHSLRLAFLTREAASPPLGGDAYLARMAAALAGAGHDVVVTSDPQSWPGVALPVIDGAVLRRCRAVPAATVGVIHHWPQTIDLDGDASTAVLRGLRRIIVPGGATARMLAERGVDSSAITVVPPGFDVLPRSLGGGACVAILSVGVLTRRKGHAVLLRALARLLDLDWSLTVVGGALGDRDEPARLAALAQSLGVAARVRWAGVLDASALERAWREADLFALASRWEGYGTAVAEALRRGLPVAATAGGDNALLVPAEAGVICPVDDSEQLSKGLRRLIFDHALRRRMAETAFEAGATLPDWPTQAEAFAAALG